MFARFRDGFSPEQIFRGIFGGESTFISWRHFKFLGNKFRDDEEFTRTYLLGPVKKTGRNSIMGADERSLLVNFVSLDSTKFLQMNVICRIFSWRCSRTSGRAPVGEECRRYQINIDNRKFSTVAIVCALGFVTWQIYEGMPAP